MTYKMFIDDERFPPNDGSSWVVARNKDQVQEIIHKNGWPSFVSFDHDLGSNQPTGMDIARWMIDMDLDNSGNLWPKNFDFLVHSQNPVGAENIQQLLDGYLIYKNE